MDNLYFKLLKDENKPKNKTKTYKMKDVFNTKKKDKNKIISKVKKPNY
jgi:hypothetical protein